MKRNLIYSILLTSLVFVGCSAEFLDPTRNTSVLTSQDLSEFSGVNPALIEGTLEGIASFMITDRGITSGHYDFGQKGVDIWTDIVSGDMALSGSAYGWYNNSANLICTVDYTQDENKIIWEYYYRIVSLSNTVIQTSGGNNAAPVTDSARKILGQAKASRAYAYYYLAQLFQKSYDPSQPILPYYDGETTETAKVPASQIYNLVVSDLTHAIELLDGYARTDKSKINQTVAQGLLAYTYAAMGNYVDAKTMADAVIASGFPLTTAGALAYPGAGSGFNDVNSPSWIWAFDLTEDLAHQLIDWWGQMDAYTYSYQWAGDYKSIDDALYAQIVSHDVRKNQFGSAIPGATLQPINKFFDPNREIGGQYIITTDLLFMRVEEFYLLSAECAARLGNDAEARTTMIELLDNRIEEVLATQEDIDDENATASCGSQPGPPALFLTDIMKFGAADIIDCAGDIQEFIYLQTKIELWGEGKTYFAMKRNQATVTRGSNHVYRPLESFVYDSDEMSFQIPEDEINNNPSISEQN